MSPTELEQYLHQHIPLSAAMQVVVTTVTDATVVLTAPLAPNINHRETAFGGSMSSLAILAAWSLLHCRLHAVAIASRVVIQQNTMNYRLPIRGAFVARSRFVQPAAWDAFVRALGRKGRARIALAATVETADQVAGEFFGEFVALSTS